MSERPAMFDKCEINQLFPSCVWLHELNDHEAMNTSLSLELQQLRAAEVGVTSRWGAWHSRGNLHTLEPFRPFMRVVAAASRGVLDFLKYRYEGFEFTNCWANINVAGQSHPIHSHPNNLLSGVYYVSAPDNCGDIVFHDPRHQAFVMVPEVAEWNPFNASIHKFTPRAGQLLLFPSWFQHLVEENRSEEERISISFNLMLKGSMGRESGAARF